MPRTGMTDTKEFQRQHWFSPAFPVGGYAYSHGIEMAVAAGAVDGPESLAAWIAGVMRLGSTRNDMILLAVSYNADGLEQWRALAELAHALAASSGRRLESAQQGAAFLAHMRSAWPHPGLPVWPDAEPLPYPVAVAIAGKVHEQPLVPLLVGYGQAFAGNLLAAGIRLAVIGQERAQAVLASYAAEIVALANDAAHCTLDSLGSMAFRSDLMALRHEALDGRLFRS